MNKVKKYFAKCPRCQWEFELIPNASYSDWIECQKCETHFNVKPPHNAVYSDMPK